MAAGKANTRLYGATDFKDVTPTDTVDSTTAITSSTAPGDGSGPVGLNIAVDGNVTLKMISGRTITLTFAAGMTHPVQFTHVLATGTTATGIRAAFQ